MSTDIVPETPSDSAIRTRTRRRGWAVLLIGLWNVWVWATRLVNALRDGGSSAAGDVVHGLLFSGSLGLAVVLVVIGWRMVHEARA